VMIFAKGPGAHLFRGVVEQSYIFHVMADAHPLLSSMVK
jgi:alkaline phosphatase